MWMWSKDWAVQKYSLVPSLCSALKTNGRILKAILYLTGNQWRIPSKEEVWFLILVTVRHLTAAFLTNWLTDSCRERIAIVEARGNKIRTGLKHNTSTHSYCLIQIVALMFYMIAHFRDSTDQTSVSGTSMVPTRLGLIVIFTISLDTIDSTI